MPPRGSGKGRKKAAVTDVVKNGSSDINELESSDKVAGENVESKKAAIDDKFSETEDGNEKSLTSRGRKKAKVNENNGISNGSGDLEESVPEPKDVEVVSKRGRKKAEIKIKDQKPMEDTGEMSESVGDSTETMKDSQESDDSQDKEPKETKILPKRGRKKAESKGEELTTQESNGGIIDVGDSANAVVDDNQELREEEPVLAKRGRKKALDSKPKAADHELVKEEKSSPKKTRGGRYIKQQTIDSTFQADGSKVEEAPTSRGGRKRKNVEEVKEKGTKKVNMNLNDEMDKDGNKELRVALERSSSLDKMAQDESDANSAKPKTAKGASKSTKGKRKMEDKEEDSKPTKVSKEISKGSSKREKIPDVTVLDFSNKSKSANGKMWNLKISSWNVNGIRAWLEKDGMSYLHHEEPDMLCVQETKCSDDKLPEDANVDGYHCYWLAGDKDGYSGVGLLSKQKPISVEYGIGQEEHDKEGRTITAEYEQFYLVTSYVPNAGKGLVRLNYRKDWDKDFRAYLKTLDEKKPVILCGDLNVAHEEIDLANPKTNKKNAGFTKEERDGFSTLLSEGFVDSFRHLYPDAKDAYTFWTYMMNARAKNTGWRLDYFVISERFTDNLCDNVIRKDVFGSDHCPVTLFLSV